MTVRGGMVLHLVAAVEREAVRPLIRRAAAQAGVRSAALQPRMEAIKREHADDAAAQQRAMMELYREDGGNPAASCLWPLAAGFVLMLPLLWSPLHQTIGGRLAGVLVVVES